MEPAKFEVKHQDVSRTRVIFFFCLAYVNWISPLKGDNSNVLRGVICVSLTFGQIVIFPGHLGKYHLFRLILLCNASTWTQSSFIGKLAQSCLIALFLELHSLDWIVNKVATTLFAMDQSLQHVVLLWNAPNGFANDSISTGEGCAISTILFPTMRQSLQQGVGFEIR